MRIIFVDIKLDLKTGGGSNFCVDLRARALQQRGHSVSLLTLFSKNNKFNSPPPYQLIEEDISPYRLLLTPFKIVKALKRLSKEADVFFFEGPDFLLAGGFYRALAGKVPVVVYINSYTPLVRELFQKPPLYPAFATRAQKFRHQLRLLFEKTAGRYLARRVDLYLTSSHHLISLYEKAGFDPKKFRVIPNFIDVKGLKSGGPWALPSFEPGFFHILYAGRLHLDKGVDLLLRAFALLGQKERCRLHIIGDGPEKNSLQHLVSQLGIRHLVSFHPWMERGKLFGFYKKADLFVHPSRWPEPYGLTLIEAMALGAPIVVSSDSGGEEIVGQAGLAFQRGSIEDLKEKMSRAINDAAFRQGLSEAGKNRALGFDWRNYAGILENTLLKLISQEKQL